MDRHPAHHRTELLLGLEAMERLAATRVILFGVGGVGSWCADALVRSGIGHLTIVDSDVVCITNVNRQLQATRTNVGAVKVLELSARLQSVNPDAEVVPLQKIYDEHTRDQFEIASFDYVIDAIDSLSSKIDLLCTAIATERTVYSAMGAACKLDPTRIKVDSIWKTSGCPLAREVRRGLRKRDVTGDLLCVFSSEVLPRGDTESPCGTERCFCPAQRDEQGRTVVNEWCSRKAQINGSVVHVTATFGFILAGLVIQDVVRRTATDIGEITAPMTKQPGAQ